MQSYLPKDNKGENTYQKEQEQTQQEPPDRYMNETDQDPSGEIRLLHENEANTFIKQHFKRELVKQREIEEEQKDKICKYFAYNIPCPDQIEFQ